MEQIKKTKVLSITVMGAPLDEYGKASTIRSKKEYRKYNKKGQLAQEIIYDAQSAIVSNTSYLHNSNGEISKRLVKNSSSITIKKQSCSFNEKGKKTLCKGIEDGKEYEISFQYDDNDNQIMRSKKYSDGTIGFDYSSIYEEGNLIQEQFEGSPLIKIVYNYDSLNQLASKITYSDSVKNYQFNYRYNSKGKILEESKLDNDGVLIEKMAYTYIDNKVVKSITRYGRDEKLVMHWRYFYDGKDNIQYIKIYEGENKTPLYQSEYIYKFYQ